MSNSENRTPLAQALRRWGWVIFLVSSLGCNDGTTTNEVSEVSPPAAGAAALTTDLVRGAKLACLQGVDANEGGYVEFGCSLVNESGSRIYPDLLRAMMKVQWELFLDEVTYKNPSGFELKMGADAVWLLPSEFLERPGRIAPLAFISDQTQQIIATIGKTPPQSSK